MIWVLEGLGEDVKDTSRSLQQGYKQDFRALCIVIGMLGGQELGSHYASTKHYLEDPGLIAQLFWQ